MGAKVVDKPHAAQDACGARAPWVWLHALCCNTVQGFCKCHDGWYGQDCGLRRAGVLNEEGACLPASAAVGLAGGKTRG